MSTLLLRRSSYRAVPLLVVLIAGCAIHRIEPPAPAPANTPNAASKAKVATNPAPTTTKPQAPAEKLAAKPAAVAPAKPVAKPPSTPVTNTVVASTVQQNSRPPKSNTQGVMQAVPDKTKIAAQKIVAAPIVPTSATTSKTAPPQLAEADKPEPFPIQPQAPPPVIQIPARPSPAADQGAGTSTSSTPVTEAVVTAPGNAQTPAAVTPNIAAEPAVASPNTAPTSPAPAPLPVSAMASISGSNDPYSAAGMPLPNLPSLARNDNAASEAPLPKAPPSESSVSAPPAGEKASTDDETRTAARGFLASVSARTGLSDEQTVALDDALQEIADGHDADALAALQKLNRALDRDVRQYEVAAGESLWVVAGLESAYGNPFLWPLIWHANEARLKKPDQLYAHLKLVIPMHPSVSEITAALELSHRASSSAQRPAAPIATSATRGTQEGDTGVDLNPQTAPAASREATPK